MFVTLEFQGLSHLQARMMPKAGILGLLVTSSTITNNNNNKVILKTTFAILALG